jgi:hypothetical protein
MEIDTEMAKEFMARLLFSDFQGWLYTLPNGEALAAQVMELDKLLADLDEGFQLDYQAAAKLAEQLAEVAAQGPHAEVMVEMFHNARDGFSYD